MCGWEGGVGRSLLKDSGPQAFPMFYGYFSFLEVHKIWRRA